MSGLEPVTDPNPSPIGGMDSLANEPTATEPDGTDGGVDERPGFDVRGHHFHVRAGVPSFLAQRLAKAQKSLPTIPDGVQWNTLTVSVQNRLLEAQAVSYDLLMSTIAEDERDAFGEFMSYADPVIEGPELATTLQSAMEAASGRPTVPS